MRYPALETWAGMWMGAHILSAYIFKSYKSNSLIRYILFSYFDNCIFVMSWKVFRIFKLLVVLSRWPGSAGGYGSGSSLCPAPLFFLLLALTRSRRVFVLTHGGSPAAASEFCPHVPQAAAPLALGAWYPRVWCRRGAKGRWACHLGPTHHLHEKEVYGWRRDRKDLQSTGPTQSNGSLVWHKGSSGLYLIFTILTSAFPGKKHQPSHFPT